MSRELGRDHTPHALLDKSESIVSVGLDETKYNGFKLGKLYGRSKQLVVLTNNLVAGTLQPHAAAVPALDSHPMNRNGGRS